MAKKIDLFKVKDTVGKGAFFSDCRKYRYALYRIWDVYKPKVMFIGLNPSTANEKKDDPTIRRVCSFAKEWGYGGVYMMNLFAFVTAYPKELQIEADPIGENNEWLTTIRDECKDVVFAWGNFDVFGRDKQVMKMFPQATCLGINKNGTPKHPLYIAKNTSQVNFK